MKRIMAVAILGLALALPAWGQTTREKIGRRVVVSIRVGGDGFTGGKLITAELPVFGLAEPEALRSFASQQALLAFGNAVVGAYTLECPAVKSKAGASVFPVTIEMSPVP